VGELLPERRAAGAGEAKRGTILHTLSRHSALWWVTLALAALALYVCWPLWPALVLAVWTAGVARPLLVRVERRLKGRRRAAAVLSLLLFLLLATPLLLMTLGVVAGAQELAATIRSAASTKSALETIATPSSDWSSPTSFSEAVELARRFGTQGVDVASKLAGVAATGLVELFIYFAAAYTFLVDGRALWTWLRRHSPLEPAHLDRLTAAFHETGRGLLVGLGLTVLTQAVVATGLYLALGVPRAWVLGPITGLAGVVPLIGSALVWVPIAVGFALTGHDVKALLLVVLGLGVISTVDHLLRPVFARLGALKMPTLLLFVSVFGGVAAFGPWGALLGPLVLRLTLEALEVHGESTEARPKGSDSRAR